LFILKFWVWRS